MSEKPTIEERQRALSDLEGQVQEKLNEANRRFSNLGAELWPTEDDPQKALGIYDAGEVDALVREVQEQLDAIDGLMEKMVLAVMWRYRRALALATAQEFALECNGPPLSGSMRTVKVAVRALEDGWLALARNPFTRQVTGSSSGRMILRWAVADALSPMAYADETSRRIEAEVFETIAAGETLKGS